MSNPVTKVHFVGFAQVKIDHVALIDLAAATLGTRPSLTEFSVLGFYLLRIYTPRACKKFFLLLLFLPLNHASCSFCCLTQLMLVYG